MVLDWVSTRGNVLGADLLALGVRT
jgi:hypothetical protein